MDIKETDNRVKEILNSIHRTIVRAEEFLYVDKKLTNSVDQDIVTPTLYLGREEVFSVKSVKGYKPEIQIDCKTLEIKLFGYRVVEVAKTNYAELVLSINIDKEILKLAAEGG